MFLTSSDFGWHQQGGRSVFSACTAATRHKERSQLRNNVSENIIMNMWVVQIVHCHQLRLPTRLSRPSQIGFGRCSPLSRTLRPYRTTWRPTARHEPWKGQAELGDSARSTSDRSRETLGTTGTAVSTTRLTCVLTRSRVMKPTPSMRYFVQGGMMMAYLIPPVVGSYEC